MRLYLKYLSMHVKTLSEYRASFVFMLVTITTYPFLEFFAIFFMFERFGNIKGWTLYEVLIPFAVISFGDYFASIFLRGFDRFTPMIRNAGFDRLLLRPRSLMLQVLGSDNGLNKIGRTLTSVFFLIFALNKLPFALNAHDIFIIILMMASSVIIFSGICILRAAFCFWTVEGLEVINIIGDGGRMALQYPLSIYSRVFRFVFTFVIPFGAANYYPLLVLLRRADDYALAYTLFPFINVFFFLLCYALWRLGVRRYASTGS